MIESPCPTFMGQISRDSMEKPSSEKSLAAFSTVPMRVHRTPCGATLLLERRRVKVSDGWEAA